MGTSTSRTSQGLPSLSELGGMLALCEAGSYHMSAGSYHMSAGSYRMSAFVIDKNHYNVLDLY